MTPKTLAATLAAAALAGSIAAVELSRDECVDLVVVTTVEAVEGWTLGSVTKETRRVCEGDVQPELPKGTTEQIVWASTVKSTKPLLSEPIKSPTVEEVVGGCACGPTDAKSDCMVTDENGKRRPRVGEFLHPGTFSGACPKQACVEASAVDALGSAKPVACGGKNFGVKVDAVAPAEKVVTDPAVEAGEVVKP
jgi:hypothetical protein